MRNSFPFSIGIGVAVAAVLLCGAPAQAICPPPAIAPQGNGTVLVSPWRTLYPGICQAAGMASQGFGGAAMPRDQRAQIVAIDLQSSGLQFFTTPNIPDQAATIFDFLDAYPRVMLAINANFAWANDAGNSYLFGLAKSQGNLVSDPTVLAAQGTAKNCPRPNGGCQANVCDATGTGTVALTITQGNQASFAILNAQSPTLPNGEGSPWPSVYTAVAGSPPPGSCGLPPRKFNASEGGAQVLAAGVNNGNANDTFYAARTAVGLDAAGRFLFFLTIDGIENVNPPYGANLYDVGQWLIIAGASDGMNLDGGGSTAMAVKVMGMDGKWTKSLINVPHGNEAQGPPYQQRQNAQFLGVILPAQDR